MKIISIIPSPEPCVEAGWHASQYYLEKPLTRDFVLSLRPLGSLLLMDKLQQPFFKIENHHYMIKGILGQDSLRVAVHRDYPEEETMIRKAIEKAILRNNSMM